VEEVAAGLTTGVRVRGSMGANFVALYAERGITNELPF